MLDYYLREYIFFKETISFDYFIQKSIVERNYIYMQH